MEVNRFKVNVDWKKGKEKSLNKCLGNINRKWMETIENLKNNYKFKKSKNNLLFEYQNYFLILI